MLAIQVSPRRKLYAKFTEDTFPNRGGFYCEVYKTDDECFPAGSFTIDKSVCRGDIFKARKYASDTIKRTF